MQQFNYTDKVLNKNFRMEQLNINQLKNQLINIYAVKNIDVLETSDFINGGMKSSYREYEDRYIPFNVEQYMFQTITLLEDNNGNIQLLDGFRRLFRTENIENDASALVCIFKKEDFTETELIYFLTTLNQPKFKGSNGSFIERGVSLFFHYNYGININALYKILYYYFLHTDINNSFSYRNISLDAKGDVVKDTILEPVFLPNLKFMHDLVKKFPRLKYAPCIGGIIYNFVKENGITLNFNDIIFTDSFIKIYDEDKFDVYGVKESEHANVLYMEFMKILNTSYKLEEIFSYNDSIEVYDKLKKGISKIKGKSLKLKTSRMDNDLKYIINDTKKVPIIRCLLRPEKSNKHFMKELYFDFEITEMNLYGNKDSVGYYIQEKMILTGDTKSEFYNHNIVLNNYMFNQICGLDGEYYKLFTYHIGFNESKEIKIIDKRK
jgi:hypothetical protein